jgi:hypothetical protein
VVTEPNSDVEREEPDRVDYVALSRAIAGHADVDEVAALTGLTKQAFEEHASAHDPDAPAPRVSEAEQAAEDFWAQTREAEALIAAKLDELGPGPEFDAWVHELGQLKQP